MINFRHISNNMHITCKFFHFYKSLHFCLIVTLLSFLCLGCQKNKMQSPIFTKKTPPLGAPPLEAPPLEAPPPSTPTPQTSTAPTNLSANPRDQKIHLAWTTPNNNSSSHPITSHEYRQKQGTGGAYGNWVSIANSGPGENRATSFTLEGLTNGVSYTFQLRAVNNGGPTSSPPSNSVTTSPVTATQASSPRAPRDLRANPRNQGVYLTWAIPSSDGGSSITKYQYQKKLTTTANYGTWENIPNSAPGQENATSFTVMGLTNGQSYHFQMRTVNRPGSGTPSLPVTGMAKRITPAPSAPRRFLASPRDTKAYLIWKTPFSDNGEPITTYEYRQKQVDAADYGDWQGIPNSVPGDLNSTSFTVTGLTNDQAYIFQLRAVSRSGNGLPSSEVIATPTATSQAPMMPRNLAANPRNKGVYLTWTHPIHDGGNLITKYQYRKKMGITEINSYGDWQDISDSAPGEATNYTVTSLTNNQAYTFQLRAVNITGNSGASKEVIVTPMANSQAPQAPRNFNVGPREAEVYLTWTPPIHDGGHPITKYQYRKADGSGDPLVFENWVDIPVSAPGEVHERSYIVTAGLNPFSTYFFEVRAVNITGNSPSSNQVADISLFAAAAIAPTYTFNLSIAPGDRKAHLTWTRTFGHDGGSPIIKYQYAKRLSTDTTSVDQWVDIVGSHFGGIHETSYTLTGLTNDANYIVKLRAMNKIGHSQASESNTFMPFAPPTPPGAPRSFIATTNNGGVDLTWKSPLDDGNGTITKYQYKIFVEGWNVILDWQDISGSGATSFNLPSLSTGFKYKFNLRAVSTHHSSSTRNIHGKAAETILTHEAAPRTLLDFNPSIKVILGIADSYKINPYRDIVGLHSDGNYIINVISHRDSITYNSALKTLSWPSISIDSPDNRRGDRLEGTIQHSSDLNQQHTWGFDFKFFNIIDTLSIQSQDGNIVLSWTVDPGVIPDLFQYREYRGPEYHAGWANIPNSEDGQKNRKSYTLPLVNGTVKSFQVKGILSNGNHTLMTYLPVKGMALPALTNLTTSTGEANPGTGGTRWVKLSWNQAASALINLIEKYVLEASLDGGTTWFKAAEIPRPGSSYNTVFHTYIGKESGKGEVWKFRVSSKTNGDSGYAVSPASSIVSISTSTFTASNPRMNDGEVRLVGGTSPNSGLVYMAYNNSWRAICDTAWNDHNGGVACRQMGYPGVETSVANHGRILSAPLHSAYWMDNVACDSAESSLLDCQHSTPIGTHNCDLTNAISITCTDIDANNNNDYTIGPPAREGTDF